MNHTEPNSPVFDSPFHDTKGGSGILRFTTYFESTLCQGAIPLQRECPYVWNVTANGIEVAIVKPVMFNCEGLEEDIYNAMKQEMDFNQLNFITQ